MGSVRLSAWLVRGCRGKGRALTPRRVPLWLAESSGEALIELGARKAVILRPAGLDLDRAHERCNMSGGPPVEPVQESVDEPGAERIAATGRVHHLAHRRR